MCHALFSDYLEYIGLFFEFYLFLYETIEKIQICFLFLAHIFVTVDQQGPDLYGRPRTLDLKNNEFSFFINPGPVDQYIYLLGNTISPTPPPAGPIIDCNNITSDLIAIYCSLNVTTINSTTAGTIAQNSTNALNVSHATPKDVYAVSVILDTITTNTTSLTNNSFISISILTDSLLKISTETILNSTQWQTTNKVLNSVTNLHVKSPIDACFINGTNVGVCNRVLNCSNPESSGFSDNKNNFSKNAHDSESVASIQVLPDTNCLPNQQIGYTIYRNNKLFISNYRTSNSDTQPMLNASDLQDRCNFGFFQANEQILSAGFFGDSDGNDKSFLAGRDHMTTKIRYSKSTQKRKPLHGKLKITTYNVGGNGWESSPTCEIEETGDFWTSTCTKNGSNGDFAMVNDGRNTDPTLCSHTLEILFYAIDGLSFVCLIIVNGIMIKKRCSSKKTEEQNAIIDYVYNIALMSFFICYTFFVDQKHSGKYACYAIAGVTYWLLLICIFVKMFQALNILEPYIAKGILKKFYTFIVSWPFVVFVSIILASGLAGGFGIFMNNFYRRDDNLCWIRSDYIVSGVILPMCHLVANAFIFVVLMVAITIAPIIKDEEKKKKKSGKKNKKRSPMKRTIFKALASISTQLILALPFLMQRLSLYASGTNVWHYLFVGINGCQGVIQFVLLSLSQFFLNESSDEKNGNENDEKKKKRTKKLDEEDNTSLGWDLDKPKKDAKNSKKIENGGGIYKRSHENTHPYENINNEKKNINNRPTIDKRESGKNYETTNSGWSL